MSANFQKEDKNWLLGITSYQRKLNEFEEAMVLASFDAETGYDVQKIEKEVLEVKFLKRVCLLKLLLFFPEAILTYILFDKKYLISKKEIAKLYYKFLLGKITLSFFRKELNYLMKDVSI